VSARKFRDSPTRLQCALSPLSNERSDHYDEIDGSTQLNADGLRGGRGDLTSNISLARYTRAPGAQLTTTWMVIGGNNGMHC
jgi:hypothetical protein